MRGIITVIAILAVVILGVSLAFPERLGSLDTSGALPALIQSVMVAILVGSGLFAAKDEGTRPGKLILYGAIWVGIVLFLVAAYSQRDSFARLGQSVMGEINPSSVQTGPDRTLTLRRSADGHFHAETRINGRAVRMLVDTGATDIALDKADARRAGIDTASLVFNIPINTAAGRSSAAFVRLDTLSVGEITVDNVEALVMEEETGTSLLGMGFLNRLSQVQVEGDTMRLTQ